MLENSGFEIRHPGSSYGVLYGLPKIHKPNVPVRPILCSYNTPNYKLAKFLVPLLEPFSKNKYTVLNSEEFQKKIVCQDSDLFMVSLDVESLFTNIPVEETINIILDKIFTEPDLLYCNFNRPDFNKLIELAVPYLKLNMTLIAFLNLLIHVMPI